MIFKRREKPPLWERLREAVYPRKGLWRGMDYSLNVVSSSGSVSRPVTRRAT